MRLLYVCDADAGGIAEYAIRQVTALGEAGADVCFLCRPGFPAGRLQGCGVRAVLPRAVAGGMVLKRVIDRIRDGRAIAQSVVDAVLETRPDAVLMACFSEYLSPFWAPLYRRLARRGIPIGTIAHDPVRDYVVGPRWWHRWSVRQGYSFVSDVFAHDDTPVDFGGMNPAMVPVHVIPHGPFEVVAPQLGRDAVRGRHGFSASDRVFLSFGQIRDGKNLDRFLRAMTALPPAVKLLVAGASGGSGQRQPDGYQTMARELGIADRCVWDIRHVPDAEIGDLFSAADIVLMTYSARFRSASGVLNTAVTCRRPVLASAGGGPLKSMVERHRLGVFVRPDDDAAVLEGARRLLGGPPAADWDRYERDNTWRENARIVIEVFGRRAAR